MIALALGLLVLLVVLAALGGVFWYRAHGPGAPRDCPNCLGEKTLLRTSVQTLPALGLEQAKGTRQQVIETFSCSQCGHTIARNRLILSE